MSNMRSYILSQRKCVDCQRFIQSYFVLLIYLLVLDLVAKAANQWAFLINSNIGFNIIYQCDQVL